jgi:hypothetical protein
MAYPVVHKVKRLIGVPENNVPVVSITDWASGLSRNPGRKVRHLLLSLIASWIKLFPAHRLHLESVSHLAMDLKI